jgi:hypothetical protein
LSFPLGVPGDVDDMELLAQARQTTGKKKRKQQYRVRGILATSGYTLEFAADDFQDGADLCRFAVGVVEAGSAEMTVHKADHIFLMRPKLGQFAEAPEATGEMSYADRKKSITEEFGSRKKKRALKAAESNRISTENIAGADAVEFAITDALMQLGGGDGDDDGGNTAVVLNAAADALEKNRTLNLPPFNREAQTLEDAYPLDGLVPQAVADAMKQSYTEMDDPDTFIRTVLQESAFETVRLVAAQIPDLVASADLQASKAAKKAERKRREVATRVWLLQALLAMHAKFAVAHDRSVTLDDLERHVGAARLPEEAMTHVRTTFCTSRAVKGKPGVQCSGPKLDKLLLHAMVLALHVNRFTLNLTALARDLHTQPRDLGTKARELGCKVTKKDGSGGAADGGSGGNNNNKKDDLAELVVPLTFPERRKPPTPNKR